MTDFTNKLREIREKMWTTKPHEIEEMLDKQKVLKDSWGSCFFPTLYAWEESVAARNSLVVLRKTMLQNRDIDLNTVKQIVNNFLDLYVSYFRMTNLRETTELFREASNAVSGIATREALIELLEELVRYTGKLHYWIEPLMPWEQLIRAFDKATK